MQVWVVMLCLLNGDVADGYSWEKEASPEISENKDMFGNISLRERERTSWKALVGASGCLKAGE